MYGGYGTGEPAIPLAAARRSVRRHERPDRGDAGRWVAVSIAESHAVAEPGVIDHKPARRVAGQQYEVLIAAQLDFGDDGAAGIELTLDQPQVWTEPPGEGDPSAAVGGDGGPDQLVV